MAEKKNIRLILEYDGTHYHGWQRQKEKPTIQGILEEMIRLILNEPITLIASGRTDAGVHALNQVCHFLTYTTIDPESIRKGLNSLIPDNIFVKKAGYVPLDFHSRYSAISKIYEYRILVRKDPNPFVRNFTWHIPYGLEIEKMKQCLLLLVGKRDFSSFRSTGSRARDPVREILKAELQGPRDDIISFLFEANGFLRHMVRNIVGTVVEVGRGRTGLDEFEEIICAKNRQMAGVKAPPQGLFLKMVKY